MRQTQLDAAHGAEAFRMPPSAPGEGGTPVGGGVADAIVGVKFLWESIGDYLQMVPYRYRLIWDLLGLYFGSRNRGKDKLFVLAIEKVVVINRKN